MFTERELKFSGNNLIYFFQLFSTSFLSVNRPCDLSPDEDFCQMKRSVKYVWNLDHDFVNTS